MEQSAASMSATLDPEIAAFFAALPPNTFDFDEWTLETIPARRAARADAPPPAVPPTTTVFRDARVDANVQVRVYSPPDAGRDRPCVFWIHGGGYISGTALTVDARLNRWVEALDCVVVAVEYRLAPEHPFPTPLEDCYNALAWTVSNSDAIGVDAARIVLAGASAGGGLGAALALLARDRGGPAITYQLLLYPMLDDRQSTPSARMPATLVWGRPANALGWRAYLGNVATDVPAYAAAARAVDLAGLPPAFVAVGGADLFRDESIDYARLLAAVVPTELHVYPGAPHGFDVLATRSDVARRCNTDIVYALRRALYPVGPGLESSMAS